MIKEFDEFPVFYFSNHNSMFADKDDIELMPDHFEKLDFELEFAAIIGKKGKNILSKNADKYIAGFCILNDISARTLQSEEMKLNLGPAKGKDFANVIGPYLVTTDELKHKEIKTPFGKKYDLEMRCYVNGDLISSGNGVQTRPSCDRSIWSTAMSIMRCRRMRKSSQSSGSRLSVSGTFGMSGLAMFYRSSLFCVETTDSGVGERMGRTLPAS